MPPVGEGERDVENQVNSLIRCVSYSKILCSRTYGHAMGVRVAEGRFTQEGNHLKILDVFFQARRVLLFNHKYRLIDLSNCLGVALPVCFWKRR